MATDDPPLIYGADTTDDDAPTQPVSINGRVILPDGTVETSATSSDGGLSLAQIAVSKPESVTTAALGDQDAIELSKALEPGDTLEVYRWGARKVANGSVPTGLEVRLLDGTDTVVASEQTALTQSTDTPVASHENTGSSVEIVKLQAFNGTGGAIDADGDGVGSEFGAVVV
jgi:hypothetical protein